MDTTVAAAVNALGPGLSGTAPIAVLDTGVDPSTPELAGRIVTPLDALTPGSDAGDVDGHGTEVAGIAAGQPGLVQGISPTSPIMPIQIYNADGGSTPGAVVSGIRWAINNNAGAINVSSIEPLLNAPASDVAALSRAINDAFNRGIMVVAPMGNEGGSVPNMPAALPHVLAVGATSDTVNGTRSTFSNTGSWVDLVSPATGLTAPASQKFCSEGYGLASGTSFAAPAVAAAAAMVAQARPELTPQQRFDVLRNSARDVGFTGRDDETGFGMLNVGAALRATPPALERSPEVDDDPIYVRKAGAAKHPTLLLRSKSTKLTGTLSRSKDPSDVYPVRVGKNQRLSVSAKATLKDSVLDLNVFKPSVGDYDVSNGITSQQLTGVGGFAADPRLVTRVAKAGTYFISVEVPDLLDDADQEDGVSIPAIEPYSLSVSVKKIPAQKRRAKKRSKTAR